MFPRITPSNRTLYPLLVLGLVMAPFAMGPFATSAHASNHNSDKTILIVSSLNAPGDTSGTNRREDDTLVYYLGAGDPATPGFVDFGGISTPSLGYTVDTTGMNRALEDDSFFWIGFDEPTQAKKAAVDNADLILFSAATRTGFYTDDRYRDVSVEAGGDGTVDSLGLTVQESWNGLETPVLTFGGQLVTSKRFGWVQADGNVTVHKNDDQSNMQIPTSQLSNPFFAGLTTTPPVAPDLDVNGSGDGSGETEVQLYNWPGGQIPEIAHNHEPVARGPLLFRRAGERADLRVEMLDGSVARSGFGGEVWYQNNQNGGELIVDIPKGTDFNNPHEDPDAASAPDLDGLEVHPDLTLAEENALHAHHRPGLQVSIYPEPPTGGSYAPPQFGVAGARRVSLANWNYYESLPSRDPTLVDPQSWGTYNTPDWFTLVENVIAEMLLNPDGAVTLDGDFDTDGDVDGADFLKWQRDLGDATNLALWEDNFGATAATATASASANAVPEPSSLLLASVSVLAMSGGMRRRRQRSIF